MTTLNETPGSNRLHIGFFGKTNSGKSSLINAFTNQEVSIVFNVPGTTTDPVSKPMEIHPLGPCVLLDTAGFDDISELGQLREERTKNASQKVDIAILVVSSEETLEENWSSSKMKTWYAYFKQKETPILFVVNKVDLNPERAETISQFLRSQTKEEVLITSVLENIGISEMKSLMTRLMPKDFGAQYITGHLVNKEDLVLLVMPQDIQAPKGRLILPQVQTIRELLDKKCLVMSVTTDQLSSALAVLNKAPKLIITDSQVFDKVYQLKPKESMLTSFSVLMAAYKGDISYFLEGAKAIEQLREDSKVLIAECCTHAPLTEDIGTIKIPRMLRKRVGQGLQIDHVRGMDFPKDLSPYDLIIQCGACMFNRKYVLSRVEQAKDQHIAMTNYGITIAYITGIVDKIVTP